jgi:hypothetical protein
MTRGVLLLLHALENMGDAERAAMTDALVQNELP